MPSRVRAFATVGRYHDIEVEDDVTAYFQYDDGTNGVFITSTGEAPGTNRLEVAGERGRVVLEGDQFTFTRNEVPMSEFSARIPVSFRLHRRGIIEIPIRERGTQHQGITNNFVEAILDGAPLLAPAVEGIRSVELANAMLLSAFEDQTVMLPMDSARYEKLLNLRIADSKEKKNIATTAVPADLSGSFR